MLRSPRGWAIDLDALQDLEQMDVIYVSIHDTETGKKYHADLAAFWHSGQEIARGYGRQQVLPLKYWRVTTETKRPEPPYGPPPASAGRSQHQLSIPRIEPMTTHETESYTRQVLNDMIAEGNAPYEVNYTQCGTHADTVQTLVDAYTMGGTEQVREVWGVMTQTDAGLAAFVASDPLPESRFQVHWAREALGPQVPC